MRAPGCAAPLTFASLCASLCVQVSLLARAPYAPYTDPPAISRGRAARHLHVVVHTDCAGADRRTLDRELGRELREGAGCRGVVRLAWRRDAPAAAAAVGGLLRQRSRLYRGGPVARHTDATHPAVLVARTAAAGHSERLAHAAVARVAGGLSEQPVAQEGELGYMRVTNSQMRVLQAYRPCVGGWCLRVTDALESCSTEWYNTHTTTNYYDRTLIYVVLVYLYSCHRFTPASRRRCWGPTAPRLVCAC